MASLNPYATWVKMVLYRRWNYVEETQFGSTLLRGLIIHYWASVRTLSSYLVSMLLLLRWPQVTRRRGQWDARGGGVVTPCPTVTVRDVQRPRPIDLRACNWIALSSPCSAAIIGGETVTYCCTSMSWVGQVSSRSILETFLVVVALAFDILAACHAFAASSPNSLTTWYTNNPF